MIWLFVRHFVSIVTFALSITYTYWTLADAQVKKDEHLENQKCHFGSMYHFDFLNVCPFSTRSFFTFFVAMAHGVAAQSKSAVGPIWLGRQLKYNTAQKTCAAMSFSLFFKF